MHQPTATYTHPPKEKGQGEMGRGGGLYLLGQTLTQPVGRAVATCVSAIFWDPKVWLAPAGRTANEPYTSLKRSASVSGA